MRWNPMTIELSFLTHFRSIKIKKLTHPIFTTMNVVANPDFEKSENADSISAFRCRSLKLCDAAQALIRLTNCGTLGIQTFC